MSGTARWLVPALAFVAVTGFAGVSTKLALRDLSWPSILLWTAVVYIIAATVALSTGAATLDVTRSSAWGLVTGVCAVSSLVLSFVALRHADAGLAVPVMSAFPLVTVPAAVIILGESLTVQRVVGLLLVLAGVIVIAR